MSTPQPRMSAPSCQEISLTMGVETFPTGWQAALERAPKMEVKSTALDFEPPKAVSLRIERPSVKTHSFTFPEAPDWLFPRKEPKKAKDFSEAAQGNLDESGPTTKRRTKIKPPRDVVKLEDRLYYLLQPPLEAILAGAEIEFPFEPFPYQFEGIAFLYPRWSAVLADEMGLGKTMQAISTIRLLLAAGEVRSVLLVCPKPLVSNWRREFQLWAPEIPVTIIEGDGARRRWQWSQRNAPVKIANYEALMRDRDLVVDGGLRFDLMVLDEAQRIKNRNSATSELVRSVPRTRNWALTGTPVENRPEDLVGIFEFLSPGFLSPSMPLRDMARAAGEHILRRTKDKVLTDMPPKMHRDAHVELSPEQFDTYKTAEDDGVVRLNEMGDELTVQHVFELVLRLKQICNFDPVTGASSKLDQLEADVEEVAASGKKAIVFSQWVRTLRRIKDRLARFHPLEYHGQVPSKQREQVIDRFKRDQRSHVILMSYGAGSVGLNLQFCEYVFLFDRWWNPAIEDQAINRAHRIGAAGAVTVTRMMALGTIEERINLVLEEKRAMFEAVFSETGLPQSNGLSQSEIFGLFNLRTPKGPLRAAA